MTQIIKNRLWWSYFLCWCQLLPALNERACGEREKKSDSVVDKAHNMNMKTALGILLQNYFDYKTGKIMMPNSKIPYIGISLHEWSIKISFFFQQRVTYYLFKTKFLTDINLFGSSISHYSLPFGKTLPQKNTEMLSRHLDVFVHLFSMQSRVQLQLA